MQLDTAPHGNISDDIQPLNDRQTTMTSAIDIERCSVVEHAIMQISGMTCTGCERKLQRVLSNITGVYNVKTSLVMGLAELAVTSLTCF